MPTPFCHSVPPPVNPRARGLHRRPRVDAVSQLTSGHIVQGVLVGPLPFHSRRNERQNGPLLLSASTCLPSTALHPTVWRLSIHLRFAACADEPDDSSVEPLLSQYLPWRSRHAPATPPPLALQLPAASPYSQRPQAYEPYWRAATAIFWCPLLMSHCLLQLRCSLALALAVPSLPSPPLVVVAERLRLPIDAWSTQALSATAPAERRRTMASTATD